MAKLRNLGGISKKIQKMRQRERFYQVFVAKLPQKPRTGLKFSQLGDAIVKKAFSNFNDLFRSFKKDFSSSPKILYRPTRALKKNGKWRLSALKVFSNK